MVTTARSASNALCDDLADTAHQHILTLIETRLVILNADTLQEAEEALVQLPAPKSPHRNAIRSLTASANLPA